MNLYERQDKELFHFIDTTLNKNKTFYMGAKYNLYK
jgi:hypothetical protein